MQGEAAATKFWPNDYFERVKAMHESGGEGSIGHRCPFVDDEARKQLLRTHTTAVSSRMLYKLAQQEGGFKPIKYFSIDRVFRNESMDATHLCEFHQVTTCEGSQPGRREDGRAAEERRSGRAGT